MVTQSNTYIAEESALARAVIYRFASELFRDPTLIDRGQVDRAGVRDALAVAIELGSDPELRERACACIERAADREALAREHAKLFGPTPRAGATPYETEWLGAAGDLLQFHQISDVAAFYRGFGLDLSPECDERADHLSVELAFLHFLCVKEAYAIEGGLEDLVALTCDAERKFLGEHVARWAPAFCARLERMDGDGPLGRAARFLRAWLADECRRADVAIGDASLAPSGSCTSLVDCCVGCHQSSSCVPRGEREERDDGAV
jgi:TorA maturation chaperone TorD